MGTCIFLGVCITMTLAAWIFCVLFLVTMQWLINRNDARFKGGFATHWLNDPPFLLGIGVMQSSVLTWPYYWFPASVLETTPKEDPSGFAVYTILVRVFLCAFATAVTSKLMT